MRKIILKILPVIMLFSVVLHSKEKSRDVKNKKLDNISLVGVGILAGFLTSTIIFAPNIFTNREFDRILLLRGRADNLRLAIQVMCPGTISLAKGTSEEQIKEEITHLENLRQLLFDEIHFIKKVGEAKNLKQIN